VEGLGAGRLSAVQHNALKTAYAAKIAEECSFPSSDSVWDLQGNNGTVSFSGDAFEAFVAVPQGSYANVLARMLYSESFKEKLMQTTATALGPNAQMPILGTVVLTLEKFERQVTTTTAATTTVTTLTTTETTTSTEETTAARTTAQTHHDLRGSTRRPEAWGADSAGQRNCGLPSLMWLLAAFFASHALLG